MDRNTDPINLSDIPAKSLSARRAWIEICCTCRAFWLLAVALRKESVDRNADGVVSGSGDYVVALRKESVDRNTDPINLSDIPAVALRKESVDRNILR